MITTTAFRASSATDMELELCTFEKDDIPALVEIENLSFSTPFKEKDFYDIYTSDISNAIVAKRCGKVVGYVSFTTIIDECQIINFATHPQYRRCGVGKAVMDGLIRYCKQNGVLKVFLEVRESNVGAISLYEKYGFVSVGISKNHFSCPRENAILMNLEF